MTTGQCHCWMAGVHSQPSSVTSYQGLAMSTIMICCEKKLQEQKTVVVTEEDRVNHGRTAQRNGQASHCRPFYALQMTEVDEKPTNIAEYLSEHQVLGITEFQ